MKSLPELRTKFDKFTEHISRPGVDKLVAWLETTDFFRAPASTKFHGNYEGGLVEHVCHVAEYALSIFNWTVKYKPELEYLRESVIITALFHDVCKVNQYSMDKCWAKDDNNKWVTYMGWKFNDAFPIGHGEKSLYYINKHMELTQAEALAIRWHMGTSEPGTQIAGLTQYSYQSAFEHPLVKILIAADIASTAIGEIVDHKSLAI